MKLKISDASWKDDEEPPIEFLDYSDDEQEKRAKQDKVINRMVGAGASQEEVQRKKERFNAGRKRNHAQAENGNMHYNDQRHDNGMYASNMNPFYRQNRQYNPREMGRVTWNNYMPNYNQQYTSQSSYNQNRTQPWHNHRQEQPYSQQYTPASYNHAEPSHSQNHSQAFNNQNYGPYHGQPNYSAQEMHAQHSPGYYTQPSIVSRAPPPPPPPPPSSSAYQYRYNCPPPSNIRWNGSSS